MEGCTTHDQEVKRMGAGVTILITDWNRRQERERERECILPHDAGT